MPYTTLKISKQLHDLGIECESEKYWEHQEKGNYLFLTDTVSPSPTYPAKFYRCYSLGELPAVLKEVGKQKDWHFEAYKNHFVRIARIYATDPTKAFEYLGELLDNK